jgi:hypothetical protein
MMKRASYILLFLVSGLLLYGCENVELTSNWLDKEITVDGNDADWKNSMTFLENTRAAIGIYNDDEYLYVSICPWDTRRQNQIISKGLIVWIDPTGNYEKVFGVCYPLELEYETFLAVQRGDRKESEKTLTIFKEMQDSLKIIFPVIENPDEKNKDVENSILLGLADATAAGVSASVGNSDGRLFYELKVPLRTGNGKTYAINKDGDKPINIGFETPEISMDVSTENSTEKYTKVVSGSGMMRKARTSRVAAKGTQMSNLLHENLQLWTTVTLSPKPADEK